MGVALPTKCEISFDFKSTGGTSSNEHRMFIAPKSLYNGSGQPTYGFYFENAGGSNGQVGYRESGRSTTTGNSYTLSPNTYYNLKLVKDGTSITYYVDNSSKLSISPSWVNNYSDWCIFYCLWNSGTAWVKNIKFKTL